MDASNSTVCLSVISSVLKVIVQVFLIKSTVECFIPLLSLFKCSSSQMQDMQ